MGLGSSQMFFRCAFVSMCLTLPQHALNHGGQQPEVIALTILDQVVARAATHGVHCDRDVLGAGEHDYRHHDFPGTGRELGKKLHPIHVRQVVVEQDQVRRLRIHTIESGTRGVGFLHMENEIGCRAQCASTGESIDAVVLHQQHSYRRVTHCDSSDSVQ